MPGTQPTYDSLVWGRVQRFIQTVQRATDGSPIPLRLGPYGDMATELLTSKQHKLADEGSMFVTRTPTPGTGQASTANVTAYSATTPFIVIQNPNPVGGKNIFLDTIKLLLTAAGNPTTLIYITSIDTVPVFNGLGASAAGGNNTGVATNILLGPTPTTTIGAVASQALIWAGTVAAISAGPNRHILSNGPLRTAAPVVNDQYIFNFGGVDMALDGVLVSGAAIAQRSIPHPPVCIGPQGSFMLCLAGAGMSSAVSCEIEITHVER